MARPAPVTVNHPVLFAVGTALWVAALLVLAAARLAGWFDPGDWLWVAAAGVALGVAAILYSKHSWRARPSG
jgi:hypothetical protein